jgi:hypothetical protein
LLLATIQLDGSLQLLAVGLKAGGHGHHCAGGRRTELRQSGANESNIGTKVRLSILNSRFLIRMAREFASSHAAGPVRLALYGGLGVVAVGFFAKPVSLLPQ